MTEHVLLTKPQWDYIALGKGVGLTRRNRDTHWERAVVTHDHMVYITGKAAKAWDDTAVALDRLNKIVMGQHDRSLIWPDSG